MDLSKLSLEEIFKLAEENRKRDPIGSKKAEEKINKILDFFKKQFPRENDYLSDYYFRESFITVVNEFLFHPENSNKNYKHFPWMKKIREQLKEKFGLTLNN